MILKFISICKVVPFHSGKWAYPRVEHLKGASLSYALALPRNIREGCKGPPGSNTLAYYIYKLRT
jgi:hypothetical protein